jgi:hypothetical protein
MSEAQVQQRAIEDAHRDRVSEYLSRPDKEAQVERIVREKFEGLKDSEHLFEALGSPTYPHDSRQNRLMYEAVPGASINAREEVKENRQAYDQQLTERLLGAYREQDDTELGRTIRKYLLDPYFEWVERLNECEFREQAEYEVMGGDV